MFQITPDDPPYPSIARIHQLNAAAIACLRFAVRTFRRMKQEEWEGLWKLVDALELSAR